jgi:hypothetical protein
MDRYNGALVQNMLRNLINFLQVLYEISKNRIWQITWVGHGRLMFVVSTLQSVSIDGSKMFIHHTHGTTFLSFNQEGYVASLDLNFYKENRTFKRLGISFHIYKRLLLQHAS